jgi:hypothetical protein
MSNTDEIGFKFKPGRWALAIALLVGVPCFILSPWFLAKMQGVVNDNAAKPWSADLQKWIAHSYSYSMRPEPAAQAYEWAHDQYVRFENWDMAGLMLYDEAAAFEATDTSLDKYKAQAVYDRCATEYKDYPIGARAKTASMRMTTLGRP